MSNKDFKAKIQTTTTAQSYRFVFEEEGWAIFTVNDETCELLITSDWGSYAHRWPNAFGGDTLTEFLASKGKQQYDCDYIVNKLAVSTQSENLKDSIDEEATYKAAAAEILSCRRSREIESDTARDLWEDLKSWQDNCFDMLGCSDELAEFLGDPWDLLVKKPSGWRTVLQEKLLPFFCHWLSENVVKTP